MEYIEPKPVEKKPHATRNKIIIGSVVGTLSLAAAGVGIYFLIDRVFADFDFAELYTYTYKRDANNNIVGSIIIEADHTITPPARLRIPRQLGGHPVIAIQDEAFYNMDDIVEINFPDTIQSIGSKAFYDCDNLTSFNVPSELDSLGTDAFSETKWFKEAPNGELNVGKFLYAYKGSFPNETIIIGSDDSPLKSEYPNADQIDLRKYNHLSNGVFRNQDKLLAVEIPTTVNEINDATFSYCTKLEKLSMLGDIKSIGADSFSDCSSLKTISGLDKVVTIGKNAFNGCDIQGEIALTEVTASVGDAAFKGNKHLTKFTFNNNINAVPRNCFEGCETLANVVFPDAEYVPATSHLAYIQDYAFKGTAISYLNVPYNVITIGVGSFSDCPNLTGIRIYSNEKATKFISRTAKDGVYGEWKSIETQVQGVRALGKELFKDSAKLEEMVLINEDGVTTANQEVHIPQTLTSFGASDSYAFSNTAVTVADLTQNLTPEYLAVIKDAKGLTTINEALFINAKKLTTVTLGSKVEVIADSAFKNCIELTHITIPSTVTRLDANVFDGCVKLANVEFALNAQGKTGFTSIKTSVFRGCVELTSMDIPSSITEIEKNAFDGCIKLTNVTFASGSQLNTIGDEAFKDCAELVSINLPTSLRTLGVRAFNNCAKVISLDFGSSIKRLPEEVIKGCSSLTTLTLRSNSVVAFIKGSDYDEHGIVGVESLTTIYVPGKFVESYEAHEVWSHYDIQAIPGTEVESV